MLGRVSLTLPASASAVPLAEAVAVRLCTEAGVEGDGTERLVAAVRCLVAFSVERSYGGTGGGDVELGLELDERGIAADVHDWGVPMRRAGGPDGPLPEGLEAAEAAGDDVRLINLADDGKRLTLHVPAVHAIPIGARVVDGAADEARSARTGATAEIAIRDATHGDSTAIAQLLYRGYSFNYRHRDFYTPRWIEAQFDAGHVVSTVAEADGQVIGHHALLLDAPGEAAESGVAVIDRAWRGLGLFDRLFEHTVERARGLGLPALYGRATCAHVYSQRSEFKHGYRETALLLGGSPPAMAQAQTGEADGHTERGANLISYLALGAAAPRAVHLPAPYADDLRRLYGHLGLALGDPDPSAEPCPVPDDVELEGEDGTARLWLSGDHDHHALERVLRGDGGRLADVVYADVDLTVPAGATVEALRESGFFLSGLLHAARGGRDWLRLQRPQAPTQTAGLHLEGDTGQWLLERVLADRATVS